MSELASLCPVVARPLPRGPERSPDEKCLEQRGKDSGDCLGPCSVGRSWRLGWKQRGGGEWGWEDRAAGHQAGLASPSLALSSSSEGSRGC